jgi:3-phosphoshikimate 1-carboxyvinyltransferase
MTTAAGVPDTVRVHPVREGALGGVLTMPGDKSISHRAYLLAAMCSGTVRVTGAADSGDVRSMRAALERMGAEIVPDGSAVEGVIREPHDVLDCGNSGTAMRLLAGVCAGIDGLSVLTGDGSLRRRPMDRVVEPLRRMGATLDGRAGGRLAPLVVRGGSLRGIDYALPVASAQVKSCILLAGLGADGTTMVREPGPSRDHTERMLAWLGVDIGHDEHAVWLRPSILQPRHLRVAGDPSSAAFWLVAGVLAGGRVEIADVCANPTRLGVVDVLTQMEAAVTVRETDEWSGEPVATLAASGGPLAPAQIGGDLVVRAIDELPILAVAGAVGGGLAVRDAAELRVKESDRIAGIARLVHALGGVVDTTADGFAVAGGTRLRGGTVDSDGDHRIAMAAAVAALVADSPVTVTGFASVATSYPAFLTDLERLGGRWEAVA